MKLNHLSMALLLMPLIFYAPYAHSTSYGQTSKAEQEQMEKDALNGDTEAMLALGNMYSLGTQPVKSDEDEKRALLWFQRAAEKGNVEAQYELGDLYFLSVKFENRPLAFKWLEKAAEQDNCSAHYTLASAYALGVGKDIDYHWAYYWTSKAAHLGHLRAILDMQTIFYYGDAVTSFSEAIEKVKMDAAIGDANAQWRLGYLYSFGTYIEENENEASKWLKLSAEQNNPKAMYIYAYYLLKGPEPNNALAYHYLEIAAEQGIWGAADRLVDDDAYWAQDTSPISKDARERRYYKWLLIAAETGNPQAQNELSMYLRGFSTIRLFQDPIEAYKWHLLSRREKCQFGLLLGSYDLEAGDVKLEGERRAKAWIEAHPNPWWQTP